MNKSGLYFNNEKRKSSGSQQFLRLIKWQANEAEQIDTKKGRLSDEGSYQSFG